MAFKANEIVLDGPQTFEAEMLRDLVLGGGVSVFPRESLDVIEYRFLFRREHETSVCVSFAYVEEKKRP